LACDTIGSFSPEGSSAAPLEAFLPLLADFFVPPMLLLALVVSVRTELELSVLLVGEPIIAAIAYDVTLVSSSQYPPHLRLGTKDVLEIPN